MTTPFFNEFDRAPFLVRGSEFAHLAFRSGDPSLRLGRVDHGDQEFRLIVKCLDPFHANEEPIFSLIFRMTDGYPCFPELFNREIFSNRFTVETLQGNQLMPKKLQSAMDRGLRGEEPSWRRIYSFTCTCRSDNSLIHEKFLDLLTGIVRNGFQNDCFSGNELTISLKAVNLLISSG